MNRNKRGKGELHFAYCHAITLFTLSYLNFSKLGLKRKQPTDNEDERAAYEDFLAWRRLAQKPHEEVEEESDGEYESEEESFSSSRNASSFSTPKPSTSSAFAQFEDQMRAKGFDNMAENRKIRKGVRRSKFAGCKYFFK
jgi:hypothetical protein